MAALPPLTEALAKDLDAEYLADMGELAGEGQPEDAGIEVLSFCNLSFARTPVRCIVQSYNACHLKSHCSTTN